MRRAAKRDDNDGAMMEFRITMDAPSTPNLREHHFVRAKRVKKQRGAVARNMPKWTDGPLLVVRITRVAPRELDTDNVQGAMKAIRDQVATGLRIDDASPLVRWDYAQAKGPAEVVVQVFRPDQWRKPCGCLVSALGCDHEALARQDVEALVRGDLPPWTPASPGPRGSRRGDRKTGTVTPAFHRPRRGS